MSDSVIDSIGRVIREVRDGLQSEIAESIERQQALYQRIAEDLAAARAEGVEGTAVIADALERAQQRLIAVDSAIAEVTERIERRPSAADYVALTDRVAGNRQDADAAFKRLNAYFTKTVDALTGLGERVNEDGSRLDGLDSSTNEINRGLTKLDDGLRDVRDAMSEHTEAIIALQESSLRDEDLDGLRQSVSELVPLAEAHAESVERIESVDDGLRKVREAMVDHASAISVLQELGLRDDDLSDLRKSVAELTPLISAHVESMERIASVDARVWTVNQDLTELREAVALLERQPGPDGKPGARGDQGPPGRDGIGIDHGSWEPGVYRQGAIVSYGLGKIVRALCDTSAKPSARSDWERIGNFGYEYCGVRDDTRTYEQGDLYVDSGSCFIWWDGKGRMLAKRGTKGDTGAPGLDGRAGRDGRSIEDVEYSMDGVETHWADGDVTVREFRGLVDYINGYVDSRTKAAVDEQLAQETQFGAPIRTFRGLWSQAETYRVGDVVHANRGVWLCHTTPPEGNAVIDQYWVKFAGMGGGRGGSVATGTTTPAATTFLELTDTPSAYVAGKLIKVNPTGDALIFGDPSGASVSWGDIAGTIADQTDLTPAAIGAATAAQGGLADTAIQPADLGTAAYEDTTAFDAAGTGTGAVSSHESTYDHSLIATALQPDDDAAVLGSGDATVAYVLTSDGAGGTSWAAVSATGGHDPVTLAGTLDYITISGQEITRGAIDLAADVTGALPISAIDLDGGTDIGAALVDADLILVDDGAGGTNRKAAMSRVKTYAKGIKLDELSAPTDVTTLDASTTAHGLLVKATAPAAGLRNVVAIENGETVYSNKALYDSTNPAALGTAGPGSAVVAARRDHVHTLPKLDDLAAPDANTDLDASTTAHGLLVAATAPAAGLRNVVAIDNTETAYTNKALFDATAPAALGTAAAGTAMAAARRDHVHAAPIQTAIFTVAGTLTTGTGSTRLYFNDSRTITKARIGVGTAPTGAAVIVDVNKNGTTIFTTQSGRPEIAASGFTDESGTPDVTSLAAGDYLTVDIDQKGSTIAGADLVVSVYYQ